MLTIKEAKKNEQSAKAAPATGVMVELPKSWRPGRALSARKMAELAQALDLVQARASVRLAEPGQVLAAVARAYEKAQEAGITWPALAVWAIMHKRQGWRVLAGDSVIKDRFEQLFVMLDSGCWRYCVKCKDGLLEVDPENGFYDTVSRAEEGYLLYELPITIGRAEGYLHLDGFSRLSGLVLD